MSTQVWMMRLVTQVVLPKFGWTTTEGTVLKWLKQEGDSINEGEVICEVETEKATVELEAPGSGVLRKIIAKEGTKLQVGELVALIGELGDELPESK